MTKTTISTTALTLEPGKIFTFKVNRCENEFTTGPNFEEWITHPERAIEGYKEAKTLDGGCHYKCVYPEGSPYYVRFVTLAMRNDRREGTIEEKVYYELESSLAVNNEVLASKTEKYDSIKSALNNLSYYLNAPEKAFPANSTSIRSVDEIKKEDEALNAEGSKKAFERIPLNIRKECKEYCKREGKCSYSCILSDECGWCECRGAWGPGDPKTWEI